MEGCGCDLDAVAYNVTVQGFLKGSQCYEALLLMEKMVERGFSPDASTISILVDILPAKGQDSKLFDMIKIFVLKHYAILGLIKGLFENSQCVAARELFYEIFSKGLQPDVRTYTVMINGLCQEGLFDEAKELLIRMEECGCVPNAITFYILINAFCKKGMVCKAEDVLELIIQSGEVPSLATYNALMDGYFLRIDEAMHLFKEIPCKGLNYNVVIYNSMLQGLFENGRCASARELFDEVFSKGLQPDVCTYTVMINGLCQEGLFDEAKELLIRMEECGCVPDGIT
ncbi:hypothetical protein LguiA_012627 [Lonicera macranthoides]